MDQLALMRRANGELFTLTLKGKTHLALWPNLEGAIRYKARNPDLLCFLPALASSPFGKKSLAPLQEKHMALLLFGDNGSAHFHGGRKISWQELQDSLSASSLALARPANGDPNT
jgi:hypothetical protein